MRLLTTDTGLRFIHFNLRDESLNFPEGAVLAVEGEWQRLGALEQDPEGGWRIPIEPTEQPQAGTLILNSLFVTGDEETAGE